MRRLVQVRGLIALIAAALCASCGNNNPLEAVDLQSDSVVWMSPSNDGKVTAYLVTDFQGGATGNTYYDLVVGVTGADNGLRVLRARFRGVTRTMDIEWVDNVLRVRYSNAVIWEFSNLYPYGNGKAAKIYDVDLERRRD